MARIKSKMIPHHVKERLRHQNLQKILENVASYVPKHPAHKKETKARKLRRVVLYVKFLLQKTKELNESQPNPRSPKRLQKGKVAIPKLPSLPKTKPAKAHIVFLKKSTDPPIKKEHKTLPPITSLIDSRDLTDEDKKLGFLENTVGANFEDGLALNQANCFVDPGKATSTGLTPHSFLNKTCDNYLDLPNGYAFVPNAIRGKYPENWDENMHSTVNLKEVCVPCTEDKTNEIQTVDLANKQVFEEHQNEFAFEENSVFDMIRSESVGLEQNIQNLSTNLESNQRAYVPERSGLFPGQYKKNAILNSTNPTRSYSPKSINQPTGHEVPAIDQTSLYYLERLQPPEDSALFDNPLTDFSELAMMGNQSPHHTLFSQNSDHWSSDFVSSGESCPLTSSNEYLLSDEEGSNLHRSANLNSSLLLVPNSIIDDDSYDHPFVSPEKNCDISPEMFCDKNSCTHTVASSSTKSGSVNSSGLAFGDYEKFVDIAKLERDGDAVFVCNDPHAGMGNGRYMDRNFYPCDVHSLTPNLVPYALFGNAREGYRQIPNTQNRMVYSSCVPNEENYFMDGYHPHEIYSSINSASNKDGNIGYSGIQVKQEYPDSLSPPKNQGYPFNHLSDSSEWYMGSNLKFQ